MFFLLKHNVDGARCLAAALLCIFCPTYIESYPIEGLIIVFEEQNVTKLDTNRVKMPLNGLLLTVITRYEDNGAQTSFSGQLSLGDDVLILMCALNILLHASFHRLIIITISLFCGRYLQVSF